MLNGLKTGSRHPAAALRAYALQKLAGDTLFQISSRRIRSTRESLFGNSELSSIEATIVVYQIPVFILIYARTPDFRVLSQNPLICCDL